MKLTSIIRWYRIRWCLIFYLRYVFTSLGCISCTACCEHLFSVWQTHLCGPNLSPLYPYPAHPFLSTFEHFQQLHFQNHSIHMHGIQVYLDLSSQFRSIQTIFETIQICKFRSTFLVPSDILSQNKILIVSIQHSFIQHFVWNKSSTLKLKLLWTNSTCHR